MNNKRIINIMLYVLAFFIIYSVALPMYNGKGLPIFSTDNTIALLSQKKTIEDIYQKALDLNSVANTQVSSYNSIDSVKKNAIENAVANNVDIARTLNDINQLAIRSKVKIDNVRFSKGGTNKNVNGVSSYDINFNIEGDYSDLRDFLSKIEYSTPLYIINSISYQKSSNLADYKNSFVVSVSTFEIKN